MSGPLEKLKIIEMAGLGPCPLAGQLLADLGAEVIVIDRKSAKLDSADINRRGKRSIALDLKNPDAIAIVKQLISNTDILIEGFRPGTMEKLGLGPENAHAINPRLIYGRMTGWGQSGPLAKTAGHDINYLGLTGALHAIGHKNQPPVPPLNLAADYGGGTMFLLLGVLSALFERQYSGKGQTIDAAMVDGVPAMMGLLHTMLAKDQWHFERQSNLLDGGAPFYRTYETADGKYLSVGPLEPQFFSQLIDLCGLPQDFKQAQYDRSKWPQMHELFETTFKSKTRAEWEAVFNGSDACVGPVLDWSEIESNPHNLARNIFLKNLNVLQPAPAPRFDRTPGIAGEIAAPGANTGEILRELGYDAKTIEDLKAKACLT